jgi:CubicO group peptidase (beta-lactamase class C family)
LFTRSDRDKSANPETGRAFIDHCGKLPRLPRSSEWIDDILGNGDRQAWKDGEWAKLLAYRSMSYRGGWYVIDDEPGTLFAMGIHGQNLFVDQADRLVMAKLSSQGSPVDLPAWTLTHAALPELRRCLL